MASDDTTTKGSGETRTGRDVLMDVAFYAVISIAATLITYYVALPKSGENNAFYAALLVLLASVVAAPLVDRIAST